MLNSLLQTTVKWPIPRSEIRQKENCPPNICECNLNIQLKDREIDTLFRRITRIELYRTKYDYDKTHLLPSIKRFVIFQVHFIIAPDTQNHIKRSTHNPTINPSSSWCLAAKTVANTRNKGTVPITHACCIKSQRPHDCRCSSTHRHLVSVPSTTRKDKHYSYCNTSQWTIVAYLHQILVNNT